ncbi:MAG: replication factor C large subunit [Candidatus Aenigmarchaeota archaeon]|nr:replication factor C large subunit [Candidatus Aenigmarchaeota archaeon]NIP40295.1 replication factor C large subunit [Candidatus Aenigmarchaeota archaeon]NIQ17787.1 replication factor C large subunit [Candidatus Aenigmarchaeota archaeon]NIS73170.1 replication factor C large subunit [Candidatus Aenigmarchaeota archaeon]
MKLWTEKYRPKETKEILSQVKALKETTEWLERWRPGDKALLLYGPSGTGKTLIPEVLAREKRWFLMQINASDERDSNSIDSALSEISKNHSLFHPGKIILIDEAEGISSRDRGGLKAIIKIIKESRFPVVITVGNPYVPKLQSIRNHCKLVKLSKVNALSIEKRLREICEKEGVKADEDVLKNLARWSSGDIRSAINDLQTLCQDRKGITEKDLESLGYRERETSVFSILPTIFRSKNLNASRQAIRNCDKDPDEIFWWVENNLPQEFEHPDSLAKAFDILSRADVFRQMVSKQQNWRFKSFMIDMLAGISFAGEPSGGFTPYKSPDRFIRLAKLKRRKAMMSGLSERIGSYTHTSGKIVQNSYLPYLKIILSRKKKSDHEGIELSEEETKLILNS